MRERPGYAMGQWWGQMYEIQSWDSWRREVHWLQSGSDTLRGHLFQALVVWGQKTTTSRDGCKKKTPKNSRQGKKNKTTLLKSKTGKKKKDQICDNSVDITLEKQTLTLLVGM